MAAQTNELKEARAQLGEIPALRAELAELKAKVNEAPPAAPPAAAAAEDIEAFGDELVQMVMRTATAAVAPMINVQLARLSQRLDSIEQAGKATATTVAATAEQMFYDQLATLVPDWKVINASQEWLTWLAEADKLSGKPRQELLNSAVESGEIARVAAIFDTFKATLPAPTPVPEPAPAPSNGLESHVTPPTGGNTPQPPAGTAKPTYTAAQFEQLGTEVRKATMKGDRARAKELEAEMDAAISEGRVRP